MMKFGWSRDEVKLGGYYILIINADAEFEFDITGTNNTTGKWQMPHTSFLISPRQPGMGRSSQLVTVLTEPLVRTYVALKQRVYIMEINRLFGVVNYCEHDSNLGVLVKLLAPAWGQKPRSWAKTRAWDSKGGDMDGANIHFPKTVCFSLQILFSLILFLWLQFVDLIGEGKSYRVFFNFLKMTQQEEQASPSLSGPQRRQWHTQQKQEGEHEPRWQEGERTWYAYWFSLDLLTTPLSELWGGLRGGCVPYSSCIPSLHSPAATACLTLEDHHGRNL